MSRQLFSAAAVAIFFALTFATLAQDPKPTLPEAPAAVAAAQPDIPPPAATAPDGPSAPPAATSTAGEDQETPLRRLDATPEDSTPPAQKKSPNRRGKTSPPRVRTHSQSGNERVAIGHDASLGKGETADVVVAVFGSATNEGQVDGAVVSILGNTRVLGPVSDAAVAVLGNTYVNSKVGDAVVAVLGDVELGPEADVGGDVVSVGGTIIRDPKAVVHGTTNNVSFGTGKFGNLEWLHAWFTHCVLLARPLAIGPHLAWAWVVALSLLGLYVLLALLFSRGVEKCTETLETRPGYSLLAAVLTVLVIPIAIVLLCVTVVGILVIPFLVAGLFFAALFGKAVMLAWLGRRFTRFFGPGPLAHVAMAVLVGGIIVLALYLVPVLGFLVYKLFSWLGMGVVVYTLILGMKREKRVVPPSAVMPPPVSGAAVEGAGMGAGMGMGVMAGTPTAAPVHELPVISAAMLPRAGFWIRVAALLIDAILLGIIAGMVHHGGPLLLLLLAAYGAVMWKLKGTTIGGIVCGLKVVRMDDREIDWATAIVRALGCFLSLAVVGLGFIWVAFDDEKQSWHDKIAGTTVVRVPKGVSLL